MDARILLRRLLSMAVTLVIVSLLIFTVTEILPGDVATMILGQQATPENLATLRAKLGLDRPAHVRYLEWVGGVFRGDLGQSLRLGVPVGPLLVQRLGKSLVLAALAFTVGTPTAILLGTLAGMARDRWPDWLISVGTLVAVSVPEFVTGVLLIVVFGFWLRWLPASSLIEPGADLLQSLRHLVLPVTTLTLAMQAHVVRMTRVNMVEVMQTGYITTAKSKGLTKWAIAFRHALPNALLPVITISAINLGWLIGGLIVVESVFAYPGLGRLLLLAINNRDVPLLQAVTLLIATVYLTSSFAADLLYGYADPRIRFR